MKRQLATRRWFLVGSVGLLAAWEPGRVPLAVVNASSRIVQVRLVGDEAWIEAKVRADVRVQVFAYHGLCSPPDRWLPDEFTGLEFKLEDGSVVHVSREEFEAEAEYDHRWIYRFRGKPR